MTTEQRNPRKSLTSLSEEEKGLISDNLKSMGYEVEGLDDIALIAKMNEALKEQHTNFIKESASKAVKNVDVYLSNSPLKDKEFGLRLFNMSIPNLYLKIFSDEDKKLTDKEIWRKINKCGINPFTTAQEIHKDRSDRTIPVHNLTYRFVDV